MTMTWFPAPATTRLPLPGGEWVEVKTELRAADLRAIARPLRQDDYLGYTIAKLAAWIVDWSLKDHDGTPVRLDLAKADQRASAIENLSQRAFLALRTVIEAHEAATDQEVAGGGDPSNPAGGPASSLVSPLPNPPPSSDPTSSSAG